MPNQPIYQWFMIKSPLQPNAMPLVDYKPKILIHFTLSSAITGSYNAPNFNHCFSFTGVIWLQNFLQDHEYMSGRYPK
jgi:hypothetical protein